MELCDQTMHEALAGIAQKEFSARELVCSCLDRIDRVEQHLNAFISLTPEVALRSAEEADRRRALGEDAGPLGGLPIGFKDLLVTKNLRTTCGSKMLESFIPPYDATVVTRILQSGGAQMGKLNMDEFGMGSSNENSYFGPVRNPWDLDRVPGGSSGGSAAAVASGMSLAALGTDTGGSVRQPAALCGLAGLKPTYGRISRHGVVAFASSLDQVGVLAHDVRDCAHLLHLLAGSDPMDPTSAPVAVLDYTSELEKGAAGLSLGVPKEYFTKDMDPEIEQLVRSAIDHYQKRGVRLLEISLPHTRYALAAYTIIASAEASSNLARYDGVRYGMRQDAHDGFLPMMQKTRSIGFGREVQRRIWLGTYALSAGYYNAFYEKAMKTRTMIRQDFLDAFEKVDTVLCPTSPCTAFKLGERFSHPLAMYQSDVFTTPCSLAGLPGLSLPCGFSSLGLPVGLQVIGRPFDEATVLRVGRTYERDHDWHLRRPPLS